MTKLKIKNFGPIGEGFTDNDGYLEISQLTIICGNQATGKSTIAKLFSTLCWLEKAVYRNDYDERIVCNKDFFVNFLKNQRIHEYLKPNTEIVYIGNAYTFSFVNNNFSLKISSKTLTSYHRPKIMYSPAERNLLTTLEDVDNAKNLPPMLSILQERYRVARRTLANDGYNLPISNLKIKYDSISNLTKVISSHNTEIDISNSSSGIQSVTPLSLVSDYLSRMITDDVLDNMQKLSTSEREKIRQKIDEIEDKELAEEVRKAMNLFFMAGTKHGIQDIINKNEVIMRAIVQYYINHCFINIVEEPEQNLYPSSQKNVLDHLLKCLNRNPNNKLLITTHSPYIITFITLCAKAYELEEKGVDKKAINEIVPLDSIISGKSIHIYETSEDGKINLLKPYNNLPSDDNLLNKLMAEQNDIFVKLLELEEKYGS